MFDRFVSLRNHVLFTADLSEVAANDAESERDRRSKKLFDNYLEFMSLMRRNACDHSRGDWRFERRQLRANDETAATLTICRDCDGVVSKC